MRVALDLYSMERSVLVGVVCLDSELRRGFDFTIGIIASNQSERAVIYRLFTNTTLHFLLTRRRTFLERVFRNSREQKERNVPRVWTATG